MNLIYSLHKTYFKNFLASNLSLPGLLRITDSARLEPTKLEAVI